MIHGIAAVTRSATDACADFLRDAILSGRLADGSPVIIDRIADQLGVSHTPIREAVRRLEAEGFLVHVARKGATVRRVDPSEFEELVQIRKALEPLVLARAIERAGPGQFAPAHVALEEWSERSGAGNTLQAQWAFFMALYSPSGQTRILELIAVNWKHIQRYHQISWIESGQVRERDYELKRDLLRLCERGESHGAKDKIIEAIEWGRSLVDSRIEKLDVGPRK